MAANNPLQNTPASGNMNQESKLPNSTHHINRQAAGKEKFANNSNIDNIFSDISKPFELPGETGSTGWPEL